MKIKLTKEQQQILIVLVLFLGGGGFAFIKYFWLPTSKKIAEVRAELEQVNKQIDEAMQAQAQLAKIEKALKDLQAELDVLTQRLPKERDIPGIIDKVSEMTQRHGIPLYAITPGAAVKKQGYIENYYSLNIKASYHQLGRFLAGLVLEDRVFNTTNISFSGRDGEGKYSFGSFQLISYQYSE